MHGRVDLPSFLWGRRCILSADVVDDLWDLMQESPEPYLDEIRIWLALYHEVQIPTTALHDNLQELGLTHKLMRRAAAERDHELCANWMYNILNTYTAEQGAHPYFQIRVLPYPCWIRREQPSVQQFSTNPARIW